VRWCILLHCVGRDAQSCKSVVALGYDMGGTERRSRDRYIISALAQLCSAYSMYL